MDTDRLRDDRDPDPGRAVRRLALEHLERGPWPVITDSWPSGPGDTYTLVATIPRRRYMIKTGSDPAVVDEAKALRAIANDYRLPWTLRGAVPVVHAINTDGPPFEYMMELIESPSLARWLKERPDRALPAVTGLWEMLGSAYASTVTSPVSVERYLGPIVPSLEQAVSREAMLAGPIVIEEGSSKTPLPMWRDAIALVRRRAPMWEPKFATWTHGKLRAQTIFVDEQASDQGVRRRGLRLRVVSPQPPNTGDYVADLADLSLSLWATPVVAFAEPPRLRLDRGATVISYKFANGPKPMSDARDHIESNAARFADAHGDTNWNTRYQLFIGLRLMDAARSQLANQHRKSWELGVASFCEGLRTVCSAANLVS
jgi:hypothetical protein